MIDQQQQQNDQLPVLLYKNIFSETTCPNPIKLYMKLTWVTLYKNTTRGHDWSTATTTKWLTSCFALKNISSETTTPNSRTLYRKLPWVTLYKNTTRGRDWSSTTTTTKWPTSCFALKKHLLWNYQARFTETLQEASLHDSLAYIPRPLFVGWNMLIMTSMSMKYPLCKDVFKLQFFY